MKKAFIDGFESEASVTPLRTPESEAKGKEIQQARRNLLWTQRQLGYMAGVPFTTISKIESGHEISSETLEKIAAALEQGVADRE